MDISTMSPGEDEENKANPELCGPLGQQWWTAWPQLARRCSSAKGMGNQLKSHIILLRS